MSRRWVSQRRNRSKKSRSKRGSRTNRTSKNGSLKYVYKRAHTRRYRSVSGLSDEIGNISLEPTIHKIEKLPAYFDDKELWKQMIAEKYVDRFQVEKKHIVLGYLRTLFSIVFSNDTLTKLLEEYEFTLDPGFNLQWFPILNIDKESDYYSSPKEKDGLVGAWMVVQLESSGYKYTLIEKRVRRAGITLAYSDMWSIVDIPEHKLLNSTFSLTVWNPPPALYSLDSNGFRLNFDNTVFVPNIVELLQRADVDRVEGIKTRLRLANEWIDSYFENHKVSLTESNRLLNRRIFGGDKTASPT